LNFVDFRKDFPEALKKGFSLTIKKSFAEFLVKGVFDEKL
jgi:hypothetical protein